MLILPFFFGRVYYCCHGIKLKRTTTDCSLCRLFYNDQMVAPVHSTSIFLYNTAELLDRRMEQYICTPTFSGCHNFWNSFFFDRQWNWKFTLTITMDQVSAFVLNKKSATSDNQIYSGRHFSFFSLLTLLHFRRRQHIRKTKNVKSSGIVVKTTRMR